MLRSINRIKELIDEGHIKRIYITDIWGKGRQLMGRIFELFGDRVEVYEIRHCMSAVSRIEFNSSDAVLFFEDVIRTYNEVDDCLVHKAKEGKAFIKVLSEDIFGDYVIEDSKSEVYNLPKGSKIYTDSVNDKLVKEIAQKVANNIIYKRPLMFGTCTECLHKDICVDREAREIVADVGKKLKNSCHRLSCSEFKHKILHADEVPFL